MDYVTELVMAVSVRWSGCFRTEGYLERINIIYMRILRNKLFG